MKAAILAIGNELLRGEIVNGNAAWIAEQLNVFGVEVSEHQVLPDELEIISAAIQRMAGENEIVICTGGLGPTSDDLTREACAHALQVKLVRDDASATALRARYEKYRRHMPEINLRQADLPEGAQAIANPNGTAPGFTFQLARAQVYALPGVPAEMKPMFLAVVAPFVEKNAGCRIAQRTLRTYGLTESSLAEKLTELERTQPDVLFGYRVRMPEIDLILRPKTHADKEGAELIKVAGDEARKILGDVVFGEGEDEYAAVVGRELRARNLKLAIAESCTGGLIGELVSSVPGSSDYFVLDVVSYANSAKSDVLGVPNALLQEHGAVSEAVVREMAQGVLRIAGADLAIATTGIAGPDGGSAEKPVGTVWFALARKDGAIHSEKRVLPGKRAMIRAIAAHHALFMVRRALQ